MLTGRQIAARLRKNFFVSVSYLRRIYQLVIQLADVFDNLVDEVVGSGRKHGVFGIQLLLLADRLALQADAEHSELGKHVVGGLVVMLVAL